MRDPGLIIAEIENWRGIVTTYVVPTRGVILDKKITTLKYDGPILVDKREGIVEAIINYLTRHIRNIPVCHKNIIDATILQKWPLLYSIQSKHRHFLASLPMITGIWNVLSTTSFLVTQFVMLIVNKLRAYCLFNIYHCFHLFAMFMLLILAFLAFMLIILAFLGIVKIMRE